MKKLLVICLLLIASTAWADHWRQTASLLPGTYMMIYDNPRTTAQMQFLQEYLRATGEDPFGADTIVEGVIFVIGEEQKTEKLIRFMNVDPQTSPEKNPFLFKQVEGCWVKIDFPCVWVKGDSTL